MIYVAHKITMLKTHSSKSYFSTTFSHSGFNYLIFSVEIHIFLHELSNNQDQLEALFQACVLQWLLLNVNNLVCENVSGIHDLAYLQNQLKQGLKKNLEQTLKLSRDFTKLHFGRFISGLVGIGWITQRIQLGTDEWRFVWSN
ncbi:uncharacterized protein LOC143241680 [Tachypleus tridentatus]|uniref:uncharacterized protein LOC143241680 n=1 Tax=Tachypleus tridentatus TaxID=6853 RepID=UPI003FD19D40